MRRSHPIANRYKIFIFTPKTGANVCHYFSAWKLVPQAVHCRSRFVPLMGMMGMKKNVMNRIPVLLVNWPTVPHFPQRNICPDDSEPHVTKRVPMRKMKNISENLLFENSPDAYRLLNS
jgi:hypothetical protein